MNIRIAPDGVRIRMAMDEAQELSRNGSFSQSVSLGVSTFSLQAELSETLNEPLEFSLTNSGARIRLRHGDFRSLLEEKQKKESGLRTTLAVTERGSVEAIFEVDLFSLKKKGESQWSPV